MHDNRRTITAGLQCGRVPAGCALSGGEACKRLRTASLVGPTQCCVVTSHAAAHLRGLKEHLTNILREWSAVRPHKSLC